MTPKEKALDLLCKYEEVTCPNWEQGFNEYTKKCALIAVDEIRKTVEWYDRRYMSTQMYYWIEVKQEIEKL